MEYNDADCKYFKHWEEAQSVKRIIYELHFLPSPSFRAFIMKAELFYFQLSLSARPALLLTSQAKLRSSTA